VRFGPDHPDPLLPLSRMEVAGVTPNGQLVELVIRPMGPARLPSGLAPPVP
jgi:hypothetical protein